MINKLIPKTDKLKHFYLWSIFLAVCLSLTNDIKSHCLCIGSAILWEVYQKYIKKGKNTLKEIIMDIFFGGVLPVLLHLITKI